MIFTTRGSTRDTSTEPLVSSSTILPRSHNRVISGNTFGCNSGSPPVISTSGQLYSSTFTITSPTIIGRPSWNEYVVSHHVQRRLHAVSRTNTQGKPA